MPINTLNKIDPHAHADPHEDALAVAYEETLRAAGRKAASRFRALAPLTAAADPKQPDWTQPNIDELVDLALVAEQTAAKTAPIHKAALRSVLAAYRPLGIRFDVTSPFALALLGGTAARAGDVAKSVRDDLQKIIGDAYTQGFSVNRTAEQIVELSDQFSAAQARMLARSDLNGIANGGSVAAAKEVGVAYKQWLATEDERTRETHAEADGQTVPVDEQFEVGGEFCDYPGDPSLSDAEACNCFPAETTVTMPALRGASRRWYEGDLVRIRDASGNELAGTPNHPVLRADGRWVALGEIKEGDYLVRARFGGLSFGAPDDEHPPAEIGEVYRLASQSAQAHRVALRPMDFHGDGGEGQVDVVAIDGSLLVDREAASDEEVAEFGFTLATQAVAMRSDLLTTLERDLPRPRISAAASSLVGGSSESATLLVGHGGKAAQIGFAPATDRQAQLAQPASEYAAPDSERLGHGEEAVASLVTLAEIVKVNRESFHGWVFNLDTGQGYYSANGYACHNCRCTVTYLAALPSEVAAAGPDVSSLGMVAVYPEPEEAAALALPDGQPPEKMHITLVFLGDADSFDLAEALAALEDAAAETAPLAGVIGGIGKFADGGDGAPLLALPDVQGLSALRERVVSALAARGIESPSEHGWLPHMTLNYVGQTDPLPGEDLFGKPVSFSTLSLAIADKRTDVPLGDQGISAAGAIYEGEAMPEAQITIPLTLTVGQALNSPGGVTRWELNTPSEGAEIVDVVAAASGDIGLPLSERDRPWSAGAAGSRVKRWASSDGSGDPSKIDYSKLARAYFWRDSSGADGPAIGDLKLPFADIIGGQLTAVWRGVTAGAARLSQTQGIDQGPVQAKMAAYYRKAAKQYKDPAIKTPWAAEDVLDSMDHHAYLDDGSGSCAFCGMSAGAAVHQAAPHDVTAAAPSPSWRAVLCVEGERTEDGRLLAPGSITWRDLPLTLLCQTETASGHDGAEVCGRIDRIWREANAIMAEGVFDSGEFGLEAARLVSDEVLRGVSVDLAVLEYEVRPAPDADDQELDIADGIDAVDDPDEVFVVLDGVIGAATICAFQAIANATIEVLTAAGPFRVARVTTAQKSEALAASAVEAEAPLRPPAAWFDNPALAAPTLVTVTDEGRVFGHVAPWRGCHTGYAGRCVSPPRSRSGYAGFHVGRIETAEGDLLPIGKLTLASGHASLDLNDAAARAHYDNSSRVVAFVRAGEDEHGIWVAGALRPGVAPAMIQDLLANPLSGDWRNGELVAAHAVPVPGFPILQASAIGEDGEEATALILTSTIGLAASSAEEQDPGPRLRVLAARARGGVEALAELARS